MQLKNRVIDIFGKFLLLLFVCGTLWYYFTGMFFLDLQFMFGEFKSNMNFLWYFEVVIMGLAIYGLIPLILKGHWTGLALGVLYTIFGRYPNPISVILPSQVLLSLKTEVPTLYSVINIGWQIIVMAGVIAFYLQRRTLRKQKMTTQQSAAAGGCAAAEP